MEGRVILALAAAGVVLVLGSVAGAAIGLPAATGNEPSGDNRTAGQRAVGVVGVQEASVSGAVERARFERDFGAAETDAARATTVGAYLNRSRGRLDAVERRYRRLETARDNGSMSDGEYEARIARLGMQAETVRRLSADLADAAAGLPADVRREYDVEPARIRRVETRAGELASRARDDTGSPDASLFGDVGRMIDAYNAHVGANASGFLEGQLRGERVDLHVESADGRRAVVSFRIGEDGRFTEPRAGGRGDATIRATTDRQTVRHVAEADDPVDAFRRSLRNDDIRVEGIGIVAGLKWRLVDLATQVGTMAN